MELEGVPQRFLVDGNLQDGSKPSGGRLTDLDAIVQYQVSMRRTRQMPGFFCRNSVRAIRDPCPVGRDARARVSKSTQGAHSHRLPPYVSA